MSSQERKNVVVADSYVMEQVIASGDYGLAHRASAQEILEIEREIRPLSNKLSITGLIDFNRNSNDCIYDPAINKLIFGYSYFCDSSNAQAVNLIAENASDCEFYQQIVRLYSSIDSGCVINFQPISGGGSQSKPEFDILVAKNSLVFCLVDSDMRHPKGRRGSTAAQFKKKDFSMGGGHLAWMLEDRRELENLIPLYFYSKAANKMKGSKVDAYDDIFRFMSMNSNFSRYFDFKEGLRLAEAISLDRDYGSFWIDFLKSTSRFSSHGCFKSLDDNGCKDCPMVEGFGEKVLKSVLPELVKASRSYASKNTDEVLHAELKSLADVLMGWGCALGFGASRA